MGFCVHYRALHKDTIPVSFPFQLELIYEIGGAKIFSKLELKSDYHQIRMWEKDIEKTTFQTHKRTYEFMVMTFGLTNAPSTFWYLMNEVLKPRKFVSILFYDILF